MKTLRSPLSIIGSLLRSLSAALFCAGVLSSTASAATLVQYLPANAGYDKNFIAAADYHDLLDEPTDYTAHGGAVMTTQGTNGFILSNLGGGPAIDLTKYAGFSISAMDGYALTLTTLTFTAGSGDEFGSFQWGYRIDADNDGDFSDLGESWTLGKLWTQSADGQNYGLGRVGRPKVWNLDGLTTAGTVEFGFFATNPSYATNPGLYNVQGRDVTVAGDIVAVPEPSTYALLIGAGCVAVVYARRRQAYLKA